jgi:hypothetical protein
MEQMYILDLLDSMPRLRLSGAIMKSVLWALKELDVPNVPSFRQFRNVQKALAQKIDISPGRHESVTGNIFYQNSLEALLALVSKMFGVPQPKCAEPHCYRTGLIRWSENIW